MMLKVLILDKYLIVMYTFKCAKMLGATMLNLTTAIAGKASFLTKQDREIRALTLILRMLFFAFSGAVFLTFFSAFLWTTYCGPIQGDWVDKALGQILSKKYGQTVQVEKAKITRWSDIQFQSMKVFSKNRNLLISASSGRVRLKSLQVWKNPGFRTEIDLKGVTFSRHYYQNADKFGPWVYWMTKPVYVTNLKIDVIQGQGLTAIEILHCVSRDVVLSGGMVIKQAKILQDNILVSLSPFALFRTILS